MPTLTQSDAKRDFLSVCREAIGDQKRIYVVDKSAKRYLTLDPEKRHLVAPVLPMSAQFFKDNFSRCSSLIKDGLCFELSLRGEKRSIFARRHTKFTDPCDPVLDQWRDKITSLAQPEETELLEVIRRRFSQRHDQGSEEILQAIDRLKRGILRVAIGHRPFREGQLPDEA